MVGFGIRSEPDLFSARVKFFLGIPGTARIAPRASVSVRYYYILYLFTLTGTRAHVIVCIVSHRMIYLTPNAIRMTAYRFKA